MEEGDAWLSEGMAMTISGMDRDPREWARLRAELAAGAIPRPDAMVGDRAYSWGAVLFQFLLREAGPGPMLEMIQRTHHRDVISLLGLDGDMIWPRFLRFARERLGLGAAACGQGR
jgi:hypothetical protein